MIPELKLVDDLVGNFRFAVAFFIGGAVPNPIDIRFQRVRGLGATVETQSIEQGGQNLYSQRVPKRVTYDNLVLERGFVVGSPLLAEFNVATSLFKFAPSNVIVSLLHETGAPLAAWLFIDAFPVSWATADLDASQHEVLIDTLELSYTRMQVLRV